MNDMGYDMSFYDSYYASDVSVLNGKFDFLTCSEAIEHFYNPMKEWQLMYSLVKPGGLMGIMTGMTDGIADFSRWYYKNDPTHVSFFSRETFLFLARRDRMKCSFYGHSVVIMIKL